MENLATSLSDYLKSHTQSAHQQLEKKLVANMKQIRNTADYCRLLGLFYTYYQALENNMQPYLSIPDADTRRKADSILADIATLGGELPVMTTEVPQPEVNNYAQALGAAYVLEGSTLGGIIIAKMISKQLGIPATAGFSFFNGYGEDTVEMWNKFRTFLNDLPTAEHFAAAEAAKNTFLTFNEWATIYESVFEV
ncbi:biliverdin-producing heme oxygenase [Chitinophaga arvensicola]|nr:biliverdin-producing heme oxygenase [Chitinophaga arvensicola]